MVSEFPLCMTDRRAQSLLFEHNQVDHSEVVCHISTLEQSNPWQHMCVLLLLKPIFPLFWIVFPTFGCFFGVTIWTSGDVCRDYQGISYQWLWCCMAWGHFPIVQGNLYHSWRLCIAPLWLSHLFSCWSSSDFVPGTFVLEKTCWWISL